MKDQHYNSDFQLKKYYRVVAELKSQLGGKCVKCGSNEDLQFDHIDPETKLYTVTQIWSRPELVQEEIKKCQLLCSDCHVEKTFTEGDGGSFFAKHGTHSMYRHHKCRCEECRQANIDYHRKLALRNGEHGTVRMYGHGGCRCDECREAKRRSRLT